MQKQHEDLKSQWVTRLAAVASSLPADAASDGSETEKLQQWKQEIEEQNKSPGKALKPTQIVGQECRFHLNHVACTSFGEGLKPGKAAKSFAHSRSLEMAQPNLQRQVRSNLFPCWKKESCCCCCFCWVTVCTCSAGQRFAGTVG